jgi:hypothetical protein
MFCLDSCHSRIIESFTSKFPKHTHIGGEEFLVLKGTFKDQFGEFPALTYVRNPIGSEHAPWVDADGCTIFVKLLQMAEDDPLGTAPHHVNLETAKSQLGRTTQYGTIAQIYDNVHTGEVVEIGWLQSHAVFPVDKKCSQGEEIFVISGSVQYRSDPYTEWDWFRFPANARCCRSEGIIAGETGAILYRKTGHLTEKALSMEKIQIREEDQVDEN